MTGRSVQGLPKAVDISRISFDARAPGMSGRGRRTLAAFLTGAALLALSFCSLQGGVAAGLISSSSSPISFIVSRAQERGWVTGGGAATPKVVVTALDPSVEHKRKRAVVASDVAQASLSLPRRSVCVRLCDGYFFPVGPLSRESDVPNHEAACSGLCPDAPTQLFVEPAGSDKIEDAVSTSGAPYSALPVAFANRTATSKSCTCHRRPGEPFPLLNDFTLRTGDSIMTPKGIVVFREHGSAPYAKANFTTLAKAPMSNDKRATLAAIERAALPNLRQTVAALSPPRRSQIAFAAPSSDRSKITLNNNAIRFVEPMVATSN